MTPATVRATFRLHVKIRVLRVFCRRLPNGAPVGASPGRTIRTSMVRTQVTKVPMQFGTLGAATVPWPPGPYIADV